MDLFACELAALIWAMHREGFVQCVVRSALLLTRTALFVQPAFSAAFVFDELVVLPAHRRVRTHSSIAPEWHKQS